MGVRQGSMLSLLLFISVMDGLTEGIRGICKILINPDNVVLMGESIREMIEA